MRHVPVSILAIVAIVGIAVLMLSVEFFPQTLPFLVIGKVEQISANTIVAGLDTGEYLSNEVDSLNEVQLQGLGHGTFNGRSGRTDYIQTIRFQEPGVFAGAHLVFGNSENGQVSDFLQYDDGIFKYEIDFSSGMQSAVKDNHLPDIEDENLNLLGDTYAIVGTDVNTATKSISLRLFGGFGNMEFSDDNYADNDYTDGGVKINGQYVDAKVKIKATDSGNSVTIYSIQYILNAQSGGGGLVQVLPNHCTREYLQYPQGMLSPNFDICYKGLGSQGAVQESVPQVSGNQVLVNPSGDNEYIMIATNTQGQLYKIPLAQLPGMYGNKGRNFVFKEAANPGAPNINLGDYFLVNSQDDIGGVSNVLRYNNLANNQVYFQDLAGGQKVASFDQTTKEGDLNVGEGTYHFKVGAGNALAMDQNNDNVINGGEARFVVEGGSRFDFGPGFVITLTTPQRLFNNFASDENTQFMITFGSKIDLNVPSPQAPVFDLQSVGGGIYQGLTKYGILWTWHQNDHSDQLTMQFGGSGGVVSTGQANGQVYVTLERPKYMKQTEVPAPVQAAQCGDHLITAPEVCDPPGSVCVGKELFSRGVCSADCKACTPKPASVCGNKVLEQGEQCEADADCPAGNACQACKCVPKPAVCGNNLLEPGEQCEAAADCANGLSCVNCNCVSNPPPLCPTQGTCRVYGGCGALDKLMKDGYPQGCVDPAQQASQQIPYCNKLANGQYCNYMNPDTKKDCVCPSPPPQAQAPAPVPPAQLSLWQRFIAWLKSLFKGSGSATSSGVNCANPASCRYYSPVCGQGFEPLYQDGQFKSCIDANQGAVQGIPYCGHEGLGQHSLACNYMSTNPDEKLACVCN